MGLKLRFALYYALGSLLFLVLLGAIGYVVWQDFTDEQRASFAPVFVEHLPVLAMMLALALAAIGLIGQSLFKAFVVTPLRIVEAMQLILRSNPGHRIELHGAPEMRALAQNVNAFAEAREALQRDVDAKVAEAKQSVEQEKNRLAALMSELTQSVLVCNIEGRILLYNNLAKRLLNQPAAGTGLATGSAVGLGRSIFGVIDRDLVSHALEHLHDRLREKTAPPVAAFVTSTPAGQLIRVQMAPVLGPAANGNGNGDRPITGFVLTIENITRTFEESGKRDALLQHLTEGSRASLASIRAAIETMLAYPDMAAERQARFVSIINEEVRSLSARLDQTVNDFAGALKVQWPLEDMRGADLVAAVQRRIEARLPLAVKLEEVDPSVWLKADSYSLMLAITYLASRLQDEFGIRETRLRLEEAGRLAYLDLVWTGAVIGTETLPTWETQPLALGGEASPLTLKDVMDRHGGEVWYKYERAAHRSYFRLLIPVTSPEEVTWQPPVSVDSRPEYYDFDLFHQPGQNAELDQRKLSELTYTVFDTETTGLDPSGGDEIIQIGAVRIVNHKLLQSESIDQLIDPRRGMSKESIAIHGIKPSMLEGQPTIDKVLPAFHKFCEDTVLVAHNAAFDMRFLQMKEEKTGCRFTQPVLDTLLLSAVVHANQEAHKLEAIAQRLGINVIGRHTALGDAIVTGEVFLKMIPLLAEQGIVTLGDAREASKKTFYARVEY